MDIINISPYVVLITECITNTIAFAIYSRCCYCCRPMLTAAVAVMLRPHLFMVMSRHCMCVVIVGIAHLTTGLTTFTLVTPRSSTEPRRLRRVLHRLRPPRPAPPQHISQPTYHCRVDGSSNKKKTNVKRNKVHRNFRRRRRA